MDTLLVTGETPLRRKPLAMANWKMAMSSTEATRFVSRFLELAEDALERVDVVLCPPYTCLSEVGRAIDGSPIQLGAQNMAGSDDIAQTGQVSTALLVDAGCQWVMLGHWEVRRYLRDDDDIVNRKIHLAMEAGLRPFPLVGPAHGVGRELEVVLAEQMARILAGCQAEHAAQMAFVYEPETAIGQAKPVSAHLAEAGCRAIRIWLRQRYGDKTAETVRIIYGGSVSPESAAELLASTDVDGLGASRKGRDPIAFAEIVQQIATNKTGRKTQD